MKNKMKSRIPLLLCCLALTSNLWAQRPNKFSEPFIPSSAKASPQLGEMVDLRNKVEVKSRSFHPFQMTAPIDFNIKGVKIKKQKNSIWVDGKIPQKSGARGKNIPFQYLTSLQASLGIIDAEAEFKVFNKREDELGFKHHRIQQYFQGIEIFGGEIVLHEKDAEIISMNGIVYPTPTSVAVDEVSTNIAEANRIIYHDLKVDKRKDPYLEFLKLEDSYELSIYHRDGIPHLTWKASVYPSYLEHWLYFIDAKNGEIIEKIDMICKVDGHHQCSAPKHLPSIRQPLKTSWLDGPAIGQGIDLLGETRTIHSYDFGGTFYLLDASRNMFKSVGTDTEQPSGVIWTLDAENVAPGDDGYSGNTLTSTSENWDRPRGVSAHYNAGVAYEYFKNSFGRNSINGSGGNIVSFVNIVDEDGASLDNAFWNGAAMFYGNGGGSFLPLAAALDVAGHEMSHGVIQNTAGLVYMDESGALNESYADIFGVLIDRDDWQLGEQIVNKSVFRSGALRDMADPHNGGASLQDAGWQPRTTQEQFTGTEDNGGVHINSGIHNWAFFKAATSIGLDKAEKIFFRALSTYLLRSSTFVDARIAAVKSAQDIHGANSAEVQAVSTAFDEVGIFEGTPTNTQEDIEQNPGQDFIMYINNLGDKISIIMPNGESDIQDLVNFIPISRPSITDDGSVVVYVSDDNIMRYIIFDWPTTFETNTLTYDIGTLEDNPQSIWRNVVVSKDGNKIAAITADQDHLVYVFDFNIGDWNTFELFNPTFTEGVKTGDVLRADAMEFDHSGTYLMYDAENLIKNNAGADITFWDIGFLRVSEGAGWGDGSIQKLVSGLPENVSIGNPTFAKNSPFIIAFDVVEVGEDILGVTEDYFVYGTNIETGELNSILNGSRITYPTYSTDDAFIMFDGGSEDLFGIAPTLFAAPLNPDKISFSDVGDFIKFKQDAYWSNWFGTASRSLATSVIHPDDLSKFNVQVYPNPVEEKISIQFELDQPGEFSYEIYDLVGKKLNANRRTKVLHQHTEEINLQGLLNGIYTLRMKINQQTGIYKIVKK